MDVTLQVDGPRPQLHPRLSPFNEWTLPDGRPWTRFYRTESGYLLAFPGLADFELTVDGRGVRCLPAPDVSESFVTHLYRNQVLPLALSRQGKLVLHASAVEMHGQGIAFVGRSGLGKSTLAASLARAGNPFLTDDGLVLEVDSGAFNISPGHPAIRLWEDSERAVAPEARGKMPALEFTPKSCFKAGTDFMYCAEQKRLHRVYFLGEAEVGSAKFERLARKCAMIELVRHSFLLDIGERALLSAHFEQLSRLVSEVDFFRLDYPREFEYLPELRRAILEHVSTDNSGSADV